MGQVLEKQSLLPGIRTSFLKIMATNPIKQPSMWKKEEWPRNEQGFPESQKSGNADKESGAFIDLEKDAQKNAPPSDPIGHFSSDDEERMSRNGKRPFEKVDLASNAGKHDH